MDWTIISGMADTAAAFGVVGSLIFVGYQVRQNSKGLHQSAMQSVMSTYQDLFSHIVDSGEFAEVFQQGFKDVEKLDEPSRGRFYTYCSKLLRVYQGMHWQRQQGVLDDKLFFSMTTLLQDFALAPGWRHAWQVRRHQYDADFQNLMDTMIAEGKGTPLWPDVTLAVE